MKGRDPRHAHLDPATMADIQKLDVKLFQFGPHPKLNCCLAVSPPL